jgi:hypothetical protein
MNGNEMVTRCQHYLNERWQWGWAVGMGSGGGQF